LESVPDVLARIKEPAAKEAKSGNAMNLAERAAAAVLVY
jgi:hypothetical protein